MLSRHFPSTLGLKPGGTTDNIIGRFIYQRQVEIIQKLRECLVVE
jgi:hypothetical protein